MKYKQKDFSQELLNKIEQFEQSLKDYVPAFLAKYRPVLEGEKLELEAEFVREGEEPFKPGYRSELSIGVLDGTGELLDLHTIPIWECTRSFVSVKGELIDESIEDVHLELKEYIEEWMESE
ncbi:hypothetical protein ACFFJY_17760 [Fictibacillus aquaticus]|uniref:Uncharacterized protein n=1 Tax=Fictibacillus aquaticus TaxID=2021314 RepID=A0A235F5U2_9BACL|nr:hypothetical protein [Fictibacillus aquaticus]OYD56609.1 hypothetical protein CGZ90_16490 [Fictibacillus aquaticus]